MLYIKGAAAQFLEATCSAATMLFLLSHEFGYHADMINFRADFHAMPSGFLAFATHAPDIAQLPFPHRRLPPFEHAI